MEGYHPKDVNLPDFTPNLHSETTILGTFVAASIIVFCLTWILSGLFSRTTKLEKLVICWLTFNGLVHLTLEFYLALRPEFYKDKTGFIFAEICTTLVISYFASTPPSCSRVLLEQGKQYSKGDSRYLSLDSTTIALEGISIFILGPTNLLATYSVATHKSYRYVLQLAVCLGELYGAVIYYTTAFLEGNNFSASPYYFYAYFIGANSSWILIPLLLIIRSWKKICESEGTSKSKVQ